MVALVVVLIIVAFVTADFGVRRYLTVVEERKKRRERIAALESGVKLRFVSDARSLKRTEVKDPQARILAVDDEEVVLDSLRKILVPGGYSMDTVESGSEALTLLQRHDYDFLFTDLRMPEMSGVEVVKAARQLRPEVDVIVVTGYASIESAVETMKVGAMDYIQKPFTDDELLHLVGKFVIRRRDRLNKSTRQEINLVTPSVSTEDSTKYNLLSGIFFAPSHTWVSIEPNGLVTIGIDDFAQKILGKIEGVELPHEEKQVSKGESLFSIRQGGSAIEVPSPISGRLRALNYSLVESPELLNARPYEAGWVCRLEPARLPPELAELKIGADAVAWYQKEVDKYTAMLAQSNSYLAGPEGRWQFLYNFFLCPQRRLPV